MAANIATAHLDPVSRIIVGWPALALLIAVKLLAGILEHHPAGDSSAVSEPALTMGTDNASDLAGSPLPAPALLAPAEEPQSSQASAYNPAAPPPGPAQAAGQGTARPFPPADVVPGLVPAVAALLPTARAVRDELSHDGLPLTRDALAVRLREHGHPIRNDRLTPLLRQLRQEQLPPAPPASAGCHQSASPLRSAA